MSSKKPGLVAVGCISTTDDDDDDDDDDDNLLYLCFLNV